MAAEDRGLDRVYLFGIPIDRVLLTELLAVVSGVVARGGRLDVMYVNVHCMNVAAHDRGYRDILADAGLVYCDGTGVRLAARLAAESLPQRMTGADWIHDLARMAVRDGVSLFIVAGEPGVAERAASALRVRHPGLNIAGSRSGYEDAAETIQAVREARPDIVLIGMGTPTQERWIAEHRAELDVPVVWAVGALFDFVSGKLPRGPRFLTEHGFEWLCRLAVEPRKLWRRYLIGNPLFFARVMRTYWLPRALGRDHVVP